MKNFEYSVAKATRTGRKPLKTAAEMAAEFGISQQKLSALMRTDDGAPKPVLDYRKNMSGKSRLVWYSPDAVRKWWKSRVPND